jgi:DNA-binding LacI/PurR family transcriptional regulator
VTLQTIADALGVSRTTVSNAYNRPDQLARELRMKVLETAKQLGYAGPDPAARRLRSGRRATIGLIWTRAARR